MLLAEMQHDLFNLGGEFSVLGMELLETDVVECLEHEPDPMNDAMNSLKEFILPGGHVGCVLCP